MMSNARSPSFGASVREGAAELGLAVHSEQLEQLETLLNLLLEWNRRMNLTAVTDPVDVAVKHVLDSMTCLCARSFPPDGKILDVGTGAGFPGLVLKIMLPPSTVVLLDSTRKKLSFVEHAVNELGLTQTSATFGRAEELGTTPPLREAFDTVVARAVAPLRILSELCLPFVRRNGEFLAMKGPNVEEELDAAAATIQKLGGAYEPLKHFDLPFGGGRRAILPILKTGTTPAEYPRLYRDIRRKPILPG